MSTKPKPVTRRSKRSTLRRFEPKAVLPTGRVLRSYSAADVQRLRRLVTDRLECVYEPSFRRTRSIAQVRADTDGFDLRSAGLGRRVPGRKAKTLSAADEVELFLRYNYCRHRMMRILREAGSTRLTAAATRELLEWHTLALRSRDSIVTANLGLVPTMIERSRITGVDFTELISEGNFALLRSADKFDCGRGFKFSTYACRAIITSMTRAIALMARHRSRFPTEYDPRLEKCDSLEMRRAGAEEACILELRSILARNVGDLTLTEHRVLAERFGVNGPGRRGPAREQKTLRQVAESFGVTRERIRQIQNKALDKLREAIDERVFAS